MRRFCLAVLVFAGGCEKVQGREVADVRASTSSSLDPSDPDILPLSDKTLPLAEALAISEADYFQALANKDYFAPAEQLQRDALRASAFANNSKALGLVGNRETNVEMSGKLIIVLHNPRELAPDQFQATSFSIVSGGLRGVASWALVGVTLHFVAEATPDCSRHFRGCQTVPSDMAHAFANWDTGGMGLPIDVRVDSEWLDRPENHLGNTIETWALPNEDIGLELWNNRSFIGHRYRCVLPLTDDEVDACGSQAAETVEAASAQVELQDAYVIGEADFLLALSKGDFREYQADPSNVELAARVAGSLNHPSALGIRGRFNSQSLANQGNVALLVVARSPSITEELVSAQAVFVVPGPISLSTTFFADVVRIEGINQSQFSAGICGPVYFPEVNFDGQRPDMPQPISASQSGYGVERVNSARPRATLRLPRHFNGRHTIEILACSQFEPPIPPPPPSWVPFEVEKCNGLDDNSSGAIDEGTACALNACTSCVPVTCGTRRCVSIPDGCGAVIACPCP